MPYRLLPNETLQIQVHNHAPWPKLQSFSSIVGIVASKDCEFVQAVHQVSIKSYAFVVAVGVNVLVVVAIMIVTEILTDCSYCSGCC